MIPSPARCAALVFTVSVFAGMVSACGTTTALPASAPPAAVAMGDDTEALVTVVERGRHTDIAIDAAMLSGPAVGLRQTFPGATVFVFGFGDRAYLMSRDVTFAQTVAALFPGPGVVLVTALDAPPAEAFVGETVVVLPLSCARLRAISEFIARSLAAQPGGSLQRLGDGPYLGSAFYATDITYDLLQNCNRWTAAALRSGGFAVAPDGVIFSSQVMSQVQAIAAQRGKVRLGAVAASRCTS